MFEWGRAICYSGYREGQSPKTCTYPTYEQIVEDLKILDDMGFKYIRMYDPVSYAEMTCQVIRDLGLNMKMMLGPDLISEVNNPGCPWMQTNFSEEELKKRAERNDGNIEKLIRIANENSDVINVVSVGNENTPQWGANNVPVERLIQFADRLKEGTGKPVTFNEGAFEWVHLGELAEHLDIISLHSYPLWYGNTIDEGLAINKEWYAKIKEMYPDKFILFSEVGWATDCADFKQMREGEANEENQKRYFEEFWEWADSEKIISYMFEAFDEPWKGGSGANEAEKNWGIYKVDRTPKLLLR
ncbi:MAG: glycosyl hydrolase [Eubacterium sp.]|nr:glycosyl hydrolase [Eubacterium sp.]